MRLNRLSLSPSSSAGVSLTPLGSSAETSSSLVTNGLIAEWRHLPNIWGAGLVADYSRKRKNLLLPNQANCCEDGTTNGFEKVKGTETVTASAGEVDEWQGTYCLKVVTPNGATNEGITTINYKTLVTPGTAHTASVYLRGSGTVQIRVYDYTLGGTWVTATTPSTITLNDTWTRYTATRTAGATVYYSGIRIDTPTQQAATIYIDGLQLEEGGTATEWWAPPNIGFHGSTPGSDTNDPTNTTGVVTFGADDYITVGGIYSAAGTLQSGYTLSTVFYTSGITSATSKLCLVSFGSNKGVYLGSVDAALSEETITIQYDATSFTYSRGPISSGWHQLDLVWNGTQYEIWLDGIQRTGVNVNTPSVLSLSAVKMRYDGTTYGSGLSGAYGLKYNRSLSLAEREQNRAYLKGVLKSQRGITLA